MNKTRDNVVDYYHRLRAGSTDYFEITFQMTTECNFRCTYCYEDKYPGSINLESCYAVIDKLFDVDQNLDWWNGFLMGNTTKNNIQFNFFGGECLLEADKIYKICEYYLNKCNSDPIKYEKRLKSFEISVQTNGYLLRTPDVIKLLNDYGKYMKSIFITIDGSKEMHDKCRVLRDGGTGTWQVVHDNIMWFRKTYPQIPVTTKGTVSPDAMPYLYDSFLAYFDSGFRSARITIQSDCKWTKEDEKVAEEQFRKIYEYCLEHPGMNWRDCKYSTFVAARDFEDGGRHLCNLVGTCHANGAGLCLTVNDDIYACFNFTPLSIPDKLGRKRKILGTVKDGITDEGMKVVDEMLHVVDDYQLEHDKCNECTIQHTCEFCPAVNYKQTGDMSRGNKPECNIRKIEQKYAILYKYNYQKLYGKGFNRDGTLKCEN